MGMNCSAEQIEGRAIDQRAASSCGTLDSFLPSSKMYGRSAGCRPWCPARRRSECAPLPEIERPHVVQAHDVVGVRVREQDRRRARSIRRAEPVAEIGRGVDQHAVPP